MRRTVISIFGAGIIVLLLIIPQQIPQEIFHAHLQGWYPTDAQQLRATIQSCDQQAHTLFNASIPAHAIRAIIVPHAGYTYSCDIATSVYRLLSPSIKRIIILAPSHFQAFSGIAVPSFTIYQTPLGPITIDQANISALIQKTAQATIQETTHESKLFFHDNTAFKPEHACEVQLPFIQTYAPNAQVIPLIVGNLSGEQLSAAAAQLMPFINDNTVVIVSSDFTHYGTNFNYTPFTDTIQKRIKQLDSGALQTIQDYNLNAFLAYIQQTRDTICGKYPIALLLALINNNIPNNILNNTIPHLISYKTSADITNTQDNSVSYAGLVFATPKTTQESPALSQYEKRELLTFARQILEQSFAQQIPDNLLYPIITRTNSTQQGVFVTLYKPTSTNPKELRGCIGRAVSKDPLYKTIAMVTRDTAFKDSRFSPLTPEELPTITISLSILTDPRPIASYRDIVIGKHGIILTRNNQSALFLPHVPTEFGWDLTKTLTELSEKAGLSPHAWQESDTTYQVFESFDFSE